MYDEKQKLGISQKAVVFNRAGKFLTLRRSKTHPYHAFKWDLPGGDLEFGEDPPEGMRREIKEEAGIDVEGLMPFSVRAHINKVGQFWVTVAYKAQALSEEVVISWEHDDFKWVTADEFLALESSEKFKKFVEDIKGL